MPEREPTGRERVQGAELHPRHESWARMTTRGTLIGFLVFLALAGGLALWLALR